MDNALIERMKEINEMRKAGDITSKEAQMMKCKLMSSIEDDVVERETDDISGCST